MVGALDADRRDRYLGRLGFDRPPPVDGTGLRHLHRAHLRSLPFENLDIHLGRAIVLDGDAILAKLLDRGRGGYCYELNGAFAALLRSLGFEVDLLEARVYGGDDETPADDRVGIRFDHACLRVRIGDEAWLADVGFGACFQDPIRVVPGIDQVDPNGTFRLERRDDGWLDLRQDGRLTYRLATTPRDLEDFADGNHHQQTSPASHFTHNTVCSLATEGGRVTVRGLQLIETVGVDRIERQLRPEQLGSVLAERFGIVLADAEVARLAAGRPAAGPVSSPDR